MAEKIDIRNKGAFLFLRIYGEVTQDGAFRQAKLQPTIQGDFHPGDIEFQAHVHRNTAQGRIEFGFVGETVKHGAQLGRAGSRANAGESPVADPRTSKMIPNRFVKRRCCRRVRGRGRMGQRFDFRRDLDF